MNRSFFIILIAIFLSNNLFADEKEKTSKLDSCILIVGPKFHGTLYQENYIFDLSPDKSKGILVKPQYYLKPLIKDSIISWTPKLADIYEFESNLEEILKNYTAEEEYENYHLPEIREKIEYYRRQYIGFKDNNNRKHLWVKFYLDDKKLTKPDKDIAFILGGGSTVFNFVVDLEAKEVEYFSVNGPI